jgi:hypothetical protein
VEVILFPPEVCPSFQSIASKIGGLAVSSAEAILFLYLELEIAILLASNRQPQFSAAVCPSVVSLPDACLFGLIPVFGWLGSVCGGFYNDVFCSMLLANGSMSWAKFACSLLEVAEDFVGATSPDGFYHVDWNSSVEEGLHAVGKDNLLGNVRNGADGRRTDTSDQKPAKNTTYADSGKFIFGFGCWTNIVSTSLLLGIRSLSILSISHCSKH